MKKIVLVFMMVVMLFTVVACNTDATPDGMQNVALESAKFNLYVPETWISTVTSGVSGAKATVEDKSPNVIATVYYPEEALDVTKYWQNYCMPEYRTVFQGLAVLEEGTATVLGGKDAQKFVFTHTVGGDVYQIQQVMTVYEHQVYVVTYTAISTDYATYVEDVDSIIANFVFK